MSTSRSQLTEALRDRYVLERELGRSGMATVYRAQDVRHRRAVALKVLHSELAAAVGPERFLKEIELTAHLQHPHILPLFDSGRVNGRAQSIVARVLTEEPRGITAQRPSVPEHVEASVLHALEKLPADRFASAAEFAAALTGTGPAPRRRRDAPAAREIAIPARRAVAAIGLLALGLAVGAAGARLWSGRAVTPPTSRAVLAQEHGGDPRDTDIAVSADGSTVAFLLGGQVVVRRLDRVDPIPVPGSQGGESVFLSADGSRVVAVDHGELVLLELASRRREVLLRETPGVTSTGPQLPAGGRYVLVTAIRQG